MTDLDETYTPTYETPNGLPNGLPIGFDNRCTLTNERTNELTNSYQDQGLNRSVPNAPTPVDNPESNPVRWIIRKRWSFMYGSPGWYWRVSHPSLPAYFDHSLHLYSFDAAVEYACDHAKAVAP